MKINDYLSDLFFNMDLSEAKNDDGNFDETRLEQTAEWLLGTLDGLNAATDGATPKDLLADFKARL